MCILTIMTMIFINMQRIFWKAGHILGGLS